MGLLKILYRDEHYVAINKPEALIVHRTRISRDHVFALQLLRDQLGQFVYPVHRLDRPTSGVLLFGLSSEAAAAIKPAFEHQQITKTYLALVRGFTEEAGIVDYPIANERGQERKEAVTHYQRLKTVKLDHFINEKTWPHYSLVAAWPKTGRMHQIRRHFSHLRHPLIGDTTHGDGKHNRFFRETYNLHRLMLHAYRLSFKHPFSNEKIEITARFPEEFTDLFDEFEWSGLKKGIEAAIEQQNAQ